MLVYRLRFSLFVFSANACLLFFSCSTSKKEKQDFSKEIIGDWLILFADHELANDKQRKLYGVAQDSIIALLGLKTVSFREKGIFVQTDSIFEVPGKWSLNPENNNLFIRNGGKGLDFFAGNLSGIQHDTMQVVEMIVLGDQKIKLTWFLKKISDKKSLRLFDKNSNWWRRTNGIETEAQVRMRVKAMLQYFAIYFEMVSRESAYFSQSRVFLPFRYYQHSMGLRTFNEKSNFSNFFGTKQQAERAHSIISTAMEKIQHKSFPSGKDYVIEYAMFMDQLAGLIE